MGGIRPFAFHFRINHKGIVAPFTEKRKSEEFQPHSSCKGIKKEEVFFPDHGESKRRKDFFLVSGGDLSIWSAVAIVHFEPLVQQVVDIRELHEEVPLLGAAGVDGGDPPLARRQGLALVVEAEPR